MALPLIVDQLDSVDESARCFYVEDNGKYRLDLDGYEDPKNLKSALEKERQAAKDAKKLISDLQRKYDGIDPDRVKAILQTVENDEEAKLLAEGKINEVVKKRSEKLLAESERVKTEALTKAEQEALKAKKFEQRVLDSHIKSAAINAGLHAHAIEDALFRARSMFTLDENGDAIQLDQDGQAVLGKDGKTPFSPIEWLGEMKEKAPHWFPAQNSGGGAPGSKSTGTQKTVKRAVFDTMDARSRAEAIKNGITVID